MELVVGSAEEPASSLEGLLRGHHAHVLAGTVQLESIDDLATRVFELLCEEASPLAASPLTAHMAQHWVLRHGSLSAAIGHALAGKIFEGCFPGSSASDIASVVLTYTNTIQDVLSRPTVMASVLADLAKAVISDPACEGLIQPLFFYKGFQAVTTYRVAHALWTEGGPQNRGAALLLQSRMAELFAVDIHPAATIGDGVMLDHASGIVIGSTAIIGNDIYMLHSTTLGATGKPMGSKRRHPKIGSSSIIGAGCTILGDVTIGDRATIGAAAVVTRDCPEGGTMIGVNNLLKRKARGPAPTDQATAAKSAKPATEEARPQLSVRDRFEQRMAQQEDSDRDRATAKPAAGGRSGGRTYLSLSAAPSASASAKTTPSASAASTAGGEEGTYDFYGESSDWTWQAPDCRTTSIRPNYLLLCVV